MAFAPPSFSPRIRRPVTALQLALGLGAALGLVIAAVGPARLIAQIEGDRGIPPIATTTDIQIGGVQVNTTGKTSEEARLAGWKAAQKKAWDMLKGPAMSEGQIDSMVSAIVVEREQIGPKRYIATLSVIFDRAKAGQYLGAAESGGAIGPRSAPLLVIPVLYSGGVAQVFEVRGPWQRAWANFQNPQSPIDYVRPSGSGGESLLLTAGQPGRRSRTWWRHVLDEFGAADVIMPVARLERQWPGGPVRGTFTARYGPDNTWIATFELSANDDAGVPAMLQKALVQMDQVYAMALAQGQLRPDPTLTAEQHAIDSAMASLQAALAPRPSEVAAGAVVPGAVAVGTTAPAVIATYVVQFASPDARAVDAALGAVRSVPGVQGAATSSIAIGGTSVMRVTVSGDLEALASALRARGWQVTVGSNALSIRR